jgi:hypothetical protein
LVEWHGGHIGYLGGDSAGAHGGREGPLLCSTATEVDRPRNFDVVGCAIPHRHELDGEVEDDRRYVRVAAILASVGRQALSHRGREGCMPGSAGG